MTKLNNIGSTSNSSIRFKDKCSVALFSTRSLLRWFFSDVNQKSIREKIFREIAEDYKNSILKNPEQNACLAQLIAKNLIGKAFEVELAKV